MEIPSLNLPPRSRLYNLEPIGVSTPYVECLSGYSARLAEEHSSTLYYLFSKEVAPLINKPGTINLRVSFASFSKATNGLGVIAADLVDVFERLTLRRDLRVTTMLPWLGIFSSKNLTRKVRAWCPSCYEDCATGCEEVYDQLIWSVQCVTACARHKRRLEHHCPQCGQQQLTLSHRIRPGRCGRCQSWLGHRPSSKGQIKVLPLIEPEEEELIVAEEVGKLLAVAPKLPSRITAGNLAQNLQSYVGKIFMGRGVPSQTQLRADKQTIKCWLRGAQTPSLPLLLKIRVVLDIPLVSLLLGGKGDGSKFQSDIGTLNERSADFPVEILKEGADILPVDWRDEISVARAGRRLSAALYEYPPASLTKLAKELKCTRTTLRKKFPELAAQIAEKAEIYYRHSISNEKILQVLRAALKENPPPPLQDVSRRLGDGASTGTLHKKFPKESRTIVERYSVHSKRRLDSDLIERRLRAFIERVPAPSMPEVSCELGVARSVIYRKFPVLYKTISNRFITSRRARNRLNREIVKAEIKSICERAFQEGLYPYSSWVRSQLTVPCQSEVFSKIRRDVLAEINGRFPKTQTNNVITFPRNEMSIMQTLLLL
jgi:hypothetical protein